MQDGENQKQFFSYRDSREEKTIMCIGKIISMHEVQTVMKKSATLSCAKKRSLTTDNERKEKVADVIHM